MGGDQDSRSFFGRDSEDIAMSFIERFEFGREKESVSAFSKFMQGYYDSAGISKDRFDNVHG